jgi:anti-sigma B factor antagonist
MFVVNVTVEGGAVVLRLVGELDLTGRSTFDDALGAVDPGASGVVIDLSDLTFIDSTGLGCFARAQNELSARGVKLLLRSPTETVRRTMELVDLGKSIDILY